MYLENMQRVFYRKIEPISANFRQKPKIFRTLNHRSGDDRMGQKNTKNISRYRPLKSFPATVSFREQLHTIV
jgi:hypothetical protein